MPYRIICFSKSSEADFSTNCLLRNLIVILERYIVCLFELFWFTGNVEIAEEAISVNFPITSITIV